VRRLRMSGVIHLLPTRLHSVDKIYLLLQFTSQTTGGLHHKQKLVIVFTEIISIGIRRENHRINTQIQAAMASRWYIY